MVARLIPYKGRKLHSPHLVCIIAWIEVFYNLFPAAWQNGKGEESLHLRHPLPVSSKGWFFFLPEQGWFILHCVRIVSYWAPIHTSKIAKNKLRFSSLFVRQEFNFRAHFFFKKHKIQKNHFRFTPAYRGSPLSWWQGPLVFFRTSLYNENHILRQE